MLAHAVLSLLRDGADHGYRLWQRLDRLLGPAWTINLGQVYQVLDRLRRERWVDELPPETDHERGHERWPVAITPAGRAELQRWLGAPIRPGRPPPPTRSALLGRLAIGGAGCLRQVLEGIATERALYEHEHVQMARRCRELRGTDDDCTTSAQLLALEAARLAMAAHLQWLDLCTTRLTAARNDAPSSQLELCAELDDAVGRDAEVGGRRRRIPGEDGKELLAPGRHA